MTTAVSVTARRSRASASSRVRPDAMILAIIESKSAGIVSPSLTPVSTRMPGPLGSSSSSMRPGDGAKSRSASSALSRASTACPISSRLGALEPAAGRDVQLQPDEVGAGGDLGDRVLDLQPGVDLEEGERLLARVVQELDRAGAAVADGLREPFGRGLQLVGLRRRQQRRRRLLDHLLVAALHRAVAHAERPRRAVTVGDDLHLDVPRAGDQPLEEHDVVAERASGLVAGALVGVAQLVLVVDDPDAAPATAGGGLEHQRVADLARRLERVVESVDRSAAPWRDRDADLLGDQLRADLVAELAHGVGGRADERDPEARAQLGEVGSSATKPQPTQTASAPVASSAVSSRS